MKVYSHRSTRTNNHGFSLIEMLASAMILGIIAALAAPNLMALFSHHKVRNAMTIMNSAIKETQRQAIRQGISCTVNIDKVQRTMTGFPASCLPEQKEIDDDADINNDDLVIRSSFVAPATPVFSISFSAKGNTNDGGTIVVSSDSTETQSCFVIALGLGIMRTGDYVGPKTELTPDPDDCISN